MDDLQSVLMLVHIAAGFLSLASALLAASAKALGLPHRVHVLSGRTFVWGMLGICVTAIPLSLMRSQLLLFLVAVFSGYLALAGWREAVRPRRPNAFVDRATPTVMLVAAAVMLGWGTLSMVGGDSGGIVLLVFGMVGLVLAVGDLRRLARPATGAARIAQHMTHMLGATISVITAALVVNIRFDPDWVVWIAPTVLITPLIVVWSRKIRGGRLG